MSSNSGILATASPHRSITSSIFDLQKPSASSSPSNNVIQWERSMLPWRQHPAPASVSPGKFLEHMRLVSLQRFDKIAHLLAAGTTSRTDNIDHDAVKSVIARPTPLPGFVSASRRHDIEGVHLSSSSSMSAESSVDVVPPPHWSPSLRLSSTCQSVPLQPCVPSVIHGRRNRVASFLPARQPTALLPPPPPPPVPRPVGLQASPGLSPWLPRQLLSVWHRQLAAAMAAAQVNKSSSLSCVGPRHRQQSAIPPPGMPPRRHVDVLAASRLPIPACTPSSSAGMLHGKRMFSCPQCRYITDRKNNLKRHVSTMHHESDKQLECCSVQFKSKASLRDHVLIFHGAGYQCRHCGRNFCRKALLKRHLTVHSGQKDYVCARCDYATSHKSNLERHKKVHERQPSDDVDIHHEQFSDDEQFQDFRRQCAPARCSQMATGNDAIESVNTCDIVTSFLRMRSPEPEVQLADCSSCSSVDTVQERHSVPTVCANSIHHLDTDTEEEEIINVVDDLVS